MGFPVKPIQMLLKQFGYGQWVRRHTITGPGFNIKGGTSQLFCIYIGGTAF
jgi:hypothetical protein